MGEHTGYCNSYVTTYDDNYEDFVAKHSEKAQLEETIREAGYKKEDHEIRRNDIVTDLRSTEKDIRAARDEGNEEEEKSLEAKRNTIVAALRLCEERLAATNDFIHGKKEIQYRLSQELRTHRSNMITAANGHRETGCTVDSNHFSIPDL